MAKLVETMLAKWKEVGFQTYFKGTSWMFLARLFGMGIAFFVTALVARYLGPGNYGTLMYAVSFVSLFSFIASLGIDQILYREILKTPERENELLGTSFVLKLVGGGIALAATVIFSTIFLDDMLEKKLIFIISLSFIFQSFNIVNYIFQARLKNKELSYIIITTTVILSLLKVGIIFSNKGILFLSSVLVIEPIIYALFFTYYYSKNFGRLRLWVFKIDTAKEIIKDSLPLMFSTVFILIYSRIDQIMINSYIDSTAVGLYSSAVTLSEVWYFIPATIVTTLLPSIMNSRQNDQHLYGRRIIKLTIFLVAISAIIGLIGGLFAQQILHLTYGINFIPAYKVLQLYIWAGVGISIGTVINQFLVAEKLSYAILYISIIGMSVNIILNFVFIPLYGIEGAALATLISYTVGPLTILTLRKPRNRIMQLFKA